MIASVVGIAVGAAFIAVGLLVFLANLRAGARLRRTYPLQPFSDDAMIRQKTSHSRHLWGRYPDPHTPQGAAETNTSLRAATYARLARNRARGIEIACEAAILVGGAALGSTILTNQNQAAIWLLVAIIGVAVRMFFAGHWNAAANAYAERARQLRAESAAAPPVPLPPPRRRWWRRTAP